MKRLTIEDFVTKGQLNDILNRLEFNPKRLELDKEKRTLVYILLGILGTCALVFISVKLFKRCGCCKPCDCNEYYEEGLDDDFEEDFEAEETVESNE